MVTINVNRNLNAPVCTSQFSTSILESTRLGDAIVTVAAVDPDGDSVTYSILPSNFGNQQRAAEYYYISPSTGTISLKKPLTDGTQSQDTVSHKAIVGQL